MQVSMCVKQTTPAPVVETPDRWRNPPVYFVLLTAPDAISQERGALGSVYQSANNWRPLYPMVMVVL